MYEQGILKKGEKKGRKNSSASHQKHSSKDQLKKINRKKERRKEESGAQYQNSHTYRVAKATNSSFDEEWRIAKTNTKGIVY